MNVYYETDDPAGGEDKKTTSLFMKASHAIGDEDLNVANVDNYTSNVRSHAMALRYGMSSLIYGMKEMYTGELLVLGNPRMKPWDVCFLFDQYNKMAGPIEIKAVTHMFSFETGFLTEIVPNAIVIGNETSSWPVMEALKVYLAASIDIETGGRYRESGETYMAGDAFSFDQPLNPATANAVVERIGKAEKEYSEKLKKYGVGTRAQAWGFAPNPNPSIRVNDYNLSFKSADFMKRRFSGLLEDDLLETDSQGRTTVNLEKILSEYFPNADEDLFGSKNGLGQNVNALAGSVEGLFSLSAVAMLTYHYATSSPTKGAWFEKASYMHPQTAGMAAGLLGGYGVGKLKGGRWGLAFGALSYATGTIWRAHNTFNDIGSRFSASYLLAAPIIFSRLLQEEAVTILPLVKDGRPLSPVVSTRDPHSLWKSILGNMVSGLEDTILGTFDNYKENEALGAAFWRSFNVRNAAYKDDPGVKYMKDSGVLYNLFGTGDLGK